MAAINYILIEFVCPVCRENVAASATVTVASDFAGDETGRFMGRTYKLGERMAWWPEDDPDFESWTGRPWWDAEAESRHDESLFCGGVVCPTCRADLYALIEFEQLTPVRLASVGLRADWPAGY